MLGKTFTPENFGGLFKMVPEKVSFSPGVVGVCVCVRVCVCVKYKENIAEGKNLLAISLQKNLWFF